MTDLVPLRPNEAFELAEQICKSPLLPNAYRNNPVDTVVAILYGAEVGLPPMTALQRIVVINGKPTLDAQGMVALIRARGHSVVGEVTVDQAVVVGTRADNGDEMKVVFTMADARTAGLVRQNTPWTKFPKSMLWARAVSQLARELFADVLLGMSYVPEEMQAVVDARPEARPLKYDAQNSVNLETGEMIEAAVVEPVEPEPQPTDIQRAKQGLIEIIKDIQPESQQVALKMYLQSRFGEGKDLTLEQVEEACTIAAGWPETDDSEPTLFYEGEVY